MSAIIEAGRYADSKQASLLQMNPSALIEATERIQFPQSRSTGPFATQALLLHGNVGMVRPGPSVQQFLGSLGTSLVAFVSQLPSGTGHQSHQIFDLDTSPRTSWARWAETTKAILQQAASTNAAPSNAAAVRRTQRLARIQAAMGLPIQELARAFNVTRQALYKWMDASNDVKLQEASRMRFDIIEQLAEQWQQRCKVPLSAVAAEPIVGGENLLALLTKPEIDEVRIVAAFDELADRLAGRPSSRSQRLSNAGFTRRRSHRSLPKDD